MGTIAPRRRRAPRRPAVGILAAALAIAGPAGVTGCTSSESGFGLPTLPEDVAVAVIEDAGAETISLSGALAVETNGCFTWRAADGAGSEADGAWIVWPDGFRPDDEDVVTDAGARTGDRDSLEATGALVALDDLPDSGRDGYFGSFGRFCGADARGALVLIEAAAG